MTSGGSRSNCSAEQLLREPPDVIVTDSNYGGFFYQRELQLQTVTNQVQRKSPMHTLGTMLNRGLKAQAKTRALRFRSMLALGSRNVVVHQPKASTAQQVYDAIVDAQYFHGLDVGHSLQAQLSILAQRDFRTTVENPIV